IGIKAKISKSVIYHYFKNKAEILFIILHTASADLINILIEIEEQIEDPLECLREMLRAHSVMFSLKRKKEHKILISHQEWLMGKHKKILRAEQRQIYDLYMKKLNELHRDNLLNDIDHVVLAFSIFGIINSSFSWYRDGGRLSREKIADNMLNFVFNGILKSSPPS
ncbi:MAG: TetR/AcrR family transcriptional regulator, partial [Desulfobacteraceae bacterium]|nr:TetR/AcrR family transcriptional regulator [Desulfobacteraceae bacterium]